MPELNFYTDDHHQLVVKGRKVLGTHHVKPGQVILVEVGHETFRFSYNGQTWELLDKIKLQPGAQPCRI